MSLILGKSGIQKLMVGYPTVSDKYNVGPAVAAGTIYPGDLVVCDSAHSVYTAMPSSTPAGIIAGFAIATNVKVPSTYPAPQGPVPFQAGEAFGLFVSGYLAVELSVDCTDIDDVVEGGLLYLGSDGKLTTSGDAALMVGNFTGVKEVQGSKKVAEIFIPHIDYVEVK